MVIIDDGKGTGKTAHVNEQNQVRVRSTTHSEEHWASQDQGQAYLAASSQIQARQTLTFLNGEGGNVLYLKNNSTIPITVVRFGLSTVPSGGLFTIFVNQDETTLTQNVSVIPNNLNLGSANIADATVEVWDETNGDGIQGLSGGEALRTISIGPTPIIIPTGGTNSLPQGKSMTLHYENNTGVTNEFECAINFYFDTELQS